jgi:hypothetical protein
MKNLHEFPVVFVNYTLGSGGWFLASLIQQWFNPLLTVLIDKSGSGHANTFIYQINNFYKDQMHSDIGISVVNNLHHNVYSQTDRIEYLQNSININNPNNTTIVVSLHCADMDIFLEAFPNAKFVCINITPDEIIKCRFNFLYKAIAARPELFKGIADNHGKDLTDSLIRIKNLNKENLEYFSWTDPEIIKFMPKKHYRSKNVVNVNYADYINGNEMIFLDTIAEFLDIDITQEQFDESVANLVTYRFSQPPLPLN